MRALVYLATPTAAAAWTWINGHHYASTSTARVTAAHRPRPSRLASSQPAAAIASGLHGGGGGHHAEEQLLALGRRLAQDGDLESAVLQFERAAGQAPRSAVCKVELGRALVRVGRSDEGFNCLVDAFGIDSLCPGVKEGFLEYYRAEIEADPINIDHHEGLAALCVDSGRPEEAAACYCRCLELHAAQTAATATTASSSDLNSSSSLDVPTADLPFEGVPSSPTVPATDSEAAEAAEAAAARTDRWSVALFKCNASLCQWGDWDAEALALRTAVRRQRRLRRRRASGREGMGSDRRQGYAVGGGKGAADPLLSSRTASNDSRDLVDLLLLGRDDGENGGDYTSWPSRDAEQNQSSCGDAGVDGGIDAELGRPALHPFDSLSAPLSISDCLAVAQQQSRGLLAEAREDGVCGGKSQDGMREGGNERHERGEGQAWPLKERAVSPSSPSRDARGRVRLGYVSGDLMGTHPLTHLMQSTFGMHDRSRFEVFLYALNTDDGSEQRRRLEAEVEHFRDLSTLTAGEAAAAIADDGVGIVVNLGGYAGTAKSADVFALRPAPVAVSYMGFPGTMGSVEMVDYILADGTVIPPDLRRFYSEKVLEMPHCYFVNDYRQSELAVIDSNPPERADHGLPPLATQALAVDDGNDGGGTGVARWAKPRVRGRDEATCAAPGQRQCGGGATAGDDPSLAGAGAGAGAEVDGCSPVVLCNFNRLHKVDPHTFGAWMEVLRAVPGAVLWLLDGGETARTNLRQQARLAGVEEGRVVFAPLVGKEEHLQRLRLADVFVDTPLYNAHTVGCDALWAGVPMVTLRGAKMASRVGASLVEAAGMPELVTGSLEEYTQLVLALARDNTRRLSLRRRLARARMTCALFDTRRWVRDAEDLLRWAWERHEAGLPPAHRNSCLAVVDQESEGEGGGSAAGGVSCT